MKLWILKPRARNPQSADGPWNPWWNCTFAIVVQANSAAEARKVANKNAGDENRQYDVRDVWLDPKWTTCRQLAAVGNRPRLIIKDNWGA